MNDPRPLQGGLFEIDSESDPLTAHIIDPKGCCTCSHYQFRLVGTGRTCKHIDAVREFLAAREVTAPPVPDRFRDRFRAAVTTASRVPDAILPILLEKHGDNPVVQTALLYERERRKRMEAENERLKAVFS